MRTALRHWLLAALVATPIPTFAAAAGLTGVFQVTFGSNRDADTSIAVNP